MSNTKTRPTRTTATPILCLLLLLTTTQAAITTTGDVSPADPATWTTSTSAYIGNLDWGEVDIANGSAVNSSYGYIGRSLYATGEVTVDGAGSTWTNGYSLYAGYYGGGTLNITNGGALSSESGHPFIGRGRRAAADRCP